MSFADLDSTTQSTVLEMITRKRDRYTWEEFHDRKKKMLKSKFQVDVLTGDRSGNFTMYREDKSVIVRGVCEMNVVHGIVYYYHTDGVEYGLKFKDGKFIPEADKTSTETTPLVKKGSSVKC